MFLKIHKIILCVSFPIVLFSAQYSDGVLNNSYKQTALKKGTEESSIAINRTDTTNKNTKKETEDQKQRNMARMGKNYYKVNTIFMLKKNNKIDLLVINSKNSAAKAKLLHNEIKIFNIKKVENK